MIAGMTDPGKVIGFLDLAGAWDPSLAFVMGGAIAVGFFAFGLAKKRTTNFFGGAMHLPTSKDIDKRLVIGALLFGAGWGLAGFCPGPGLRGGHAGRHGGLRVHRQARRTPAVQGGLTTRHVHPSSSTAPRP
jgi:uncharacterized membrane protein YedE/YeeE